MIKKILIGLGVLIGIVLALAAMKPADSVISRELVIAATPEVIFPYINNAKKSYEWMPWQESDPKVEVKFTGPDEGLGSSSNWNGPQMGVGTSEVIESNPNQSVKTRLVYTKPFEMSQIAEMTLSPTNGGTLVKWSVSGHSNFLQRIFCVFMDMDKMVGDQFIKGLNKLKSLAENPR